MDKPATPPRRRLPKVLRVVRARPRLFVAAALAAALSLVLPAQWRVSTRVLVGWGVAVVFYVGGAFILIGGAAPARPPPPAAPPGRGRPPPPRTRGRAAG